MTEKRAKLVVHGCFAVDKAGVVGNAEGARPTDGIFIIFSIESNLFSSNQFAP